MNISILLSEAPTVKAPAIAAPPDDPFQTPDGAIELGLATFAVATMIEIVTTDPNIGIDRGTSVTIKDMARALNQLTQSEMHEVYGALSRDLYVHPVFLAHGIRRFKSILKTNGGWSFPQDRTIDGRSVQGVVAFKEIKGCGDQITIPTADIGPLFWRSRHDHQHGDLLARIQHTKDCLLRLRDGDNYVNPFDTISQMCTPEAAIRMHLGSLAGSYRRAGAAAEGAEDAAEGADEAAEGSAGTASGRAAGAARIPGEERAAAGGGGGEGARRPSSAKKRTGATLFEGTTASTAASAVAGVVEEQTDEEKHAVKRLRRVDDAFVGFGDFHELEDQLLKVASIVMGRSTSWKGYVNDVLGGEMDTAAALHTSFKNHAAVAPTLYGLLMTVMVGNSWRRRLRQRTLGDSAIWQQWCSGRRAEVSDFTRLATKPSEPNPPPQHSLLQ